MDRICPNNFTLVARIRLNLIHVRETNWQGLMNISIIYNFVLKVMSPRFTLLPEVARFHTIV